MFNEIRVNYNLRVDMANVKCIILGIMGRAHHESVRGCCLSPLQFKVSQSCKLI